MSGDTFHPTWVACAVDLQGRLESVASGLPQPVKDLKGLRDHLRAVLMRATKDERLQEPQHEIERLLRECAEPGARLKKALPAGARVLLGGGADSGERFSDGTGTAAHFTRADGAHIDFSVTIIEGPPVIKLLGYVFRLEFPKIGDIETSPRFLRIDMNLPNHDNQRDGVRVHMHPGHNDLQIPLPWLSPEQVLKLLLYGLDLPARCRHDQA